LKNHNKSDDILPSKEEFSHRRGLTGKQGVGTILAQQQNLRPTS
jgi:hypothetical protein